MADKNKHEGMVMIVPPMDERDRHSKYILLSVNDEPCLVERGVENWVAPKFAVEYNRKIKMQRRAHRYKDELEAKQRERAAETGRYSQ
jgi:hypothetical protein